MKTYPRRIHQIFFTTIRLIGLEKAPSCTVRRIPRHTFALLIVGASMVWAGAAMADGAAGEANHPDQVAGAPSIDRVIVQLRPGLAGRQRAGGRPGIGRIPGDLPPEPLGWGQAQLIDRDIERFEARLDAVAALEMRPLFAPLPANEERAREIGLDRYYLLQVDAGQRTDQVAAGLARDFPRLIDRAEADYYGELASLPPDDVHFELQYGLHNTGQSISGNVGVAGADVRALDAWSLTTGSPDIVVAVLDAGVNEHDDLVGRLVPGWNAVNPGGPTGDFCQSHGTRVAGVVAANKNNQIGVAGMAPETKVMPIVIFAGCTGNEADTANGVVYAADAGADILNMSLQFPVGTQALRDAIIYARGEGAVVIAATGNFGSSIAFPARWPEVIGVGATTNTDAPWSSSNSGPEISVAAPGRDIWSLVNFSTYSFQSGTSFASPLVAGIAALMLTLDPALSHDEIQSILETTADDVHLPGFDHQTGHGRVNAFAALNAVLDQLAPPSPDLNDDGVVDVFDLLILLDAWGACPDEGSCPADLNRSGVVDVFDLLILLDAWGAV